jgi:hypothetical protein
LSHSASQRAVGNISHLRLAESWMFLNQYVAGLGLSKGYCMKASISCDFYRGSYEKWVAKSKICSHFKIKFLQRCHCESASTCDIRPLVKANSSWPSDRYSFREC